jgi:hypothetical protein
LLVACQTGGYAIFSGFAHQKRRELVRGEQRARFPSSRQKKTTVGPFFVIFLSTLSSRNLRLIILHLLKDIV